MADISEARNHLGYMANVLASFQAADKVLAALENAEQVQKELTAACDAKRSELAAVTAAADAVNASAAKIKADAEIEADAVVAEAKAAAEKLVADAQELAVAAQSAQVDAENSRRIAEDQKATAEALRDQAAEAYGDMEAKLATAKEKLSALLV